MLICEHKMPRARAHSVFRTLTDAFESVAQRIFASGFFKRTVDLHQVGVEVTCDFVPLCICDKRAFQHNNLGLRAALVEHVLEVPKARLEAHHAEFAQGVDRRVCHLREVLTEVMAQGAILL